MTTPKFSPPQKIKNEIFNSYTSDNFICSVSKNGNKIYFGNSYKINEEPKKGISYSIKDTLGNWDFPTSLNITNFYNINNTANYCISNDEKIIILAIEDTTSIGGLDLYISFNNDSTWSQPINLGSKINTICDELSPVLAYDNKTLFFSTQGYNGFGNRDIYYTQRLDNTWNKILPIGWTKK